MEARPYTINGSWDRKSTVVKLFYGKKKYVVVKSKNEFTTLKSIEKQLAAFLRGGVDNPANMYIHLFRYVKKNPGSPFKAVLVLESESGYELLKAEQTELDRGRSNPDMLNNNTEAYLPHFDEVAETYGWISKTDAMNFKKWFKKRPKQTVA